MDNLIYSKKMLSLIILVLLSTGLFAADVFTADDLLRLRTVSDVKLSPDGNYIAYTVRVPRESFDKPGSAYSELHIIDIKTGKIRPFIIGDAQVNSIDWSPDGALISFLTNRNDEGTQVWGVPVDGGEARMLTYADNGVLDYQWHPSGKEIIYTSEEPPTDREKTLKDKGYRFIYYEGDWKHDNLYIQEAGNELAFPVQLTENITISYFMLSPDGKTIAMAGAEKNLIDYRYMFRKIYLMNINGKKIRPLSKNEGKLGNFAFSPDGKNLVYTAAVSQKDHAVSQVYIIPVNGGEAKNLTPVDFKGHVTWASWKNNETVFYMADEGVNVTLSLVNIKSGKREVILNSSDNEVIIGKPEFSKDFKLFAFLGNTPYSASEVYTWRPKSGIKRMTDTNPWINEKSFGRQTVLKYQSDDGWDIEGLLIKPVNYQQGEKYPLIVFAHGGPESNYSNGWLTHYSTPGQVLAGRGYTIFYPNYRASTGYGLEFAAAGYGDPAGKEFDDIKDGIDYLINLGIADKDRVGLAGGSYGGYAAAWFGTYFTEYVKAVCMFVGVSNLISKRGTTDIPYEELYVHSGKKLEEMWDISLKRSPIYYAHQSKTAFLILGGENDTRVHPSQSIELYTRLKMNHHPAVRLVQYPGEGHGNRKQPGRIDVLYRTLDWFDWYVKDGKPLDGEMPPLDISDKYGLQLPE
ncbi:MAG: S9 family peptidase [Calditrichaceae bacterium]|nr:S9 family peptidase [Calditrichaceae bacterium]MBN2707674.1 S9 family peptidase [Calditrichaceae bacterium]RQV97794.1 MAG: S9 family peptidase [Calditrichota bacterium]